jgi:hypothetical protein
LSKRQLRKLKKKQKTEGDAAAAAADCSSGDAAAAARGAMLASLKGCWGTIVQAPAGSFLAEAVFNTMVSRRKTLDKTLCCRHCYFTFLNASPFGT